MSAQTNTETFVRFVLGVLDEKRATDVAWLDLRGITDIADEFLIATVTNPRQSSAIVDACEKERKARGLRCLGIEGKGASSWVVLDYGDIVVHLLTPEAREYYQLEHLWADAVRKDAP
ncbi:MAG: ribosome silencing factor [Planctomycetota bacterium]|jgi:ribosome-associated protein